MQPNLTNFEFFFEVLFKFYSKNTAPTRPENVRMGVTGVKARILPSAARHVVGRALRASTERSSASGFYY